MPLSMTIVMYSFSILVGVLFVVLGLRIKPQKQESSSDMHESWCPHGLGIPTVERLPLGYPDEFPEWEKCGEGGPGGYSLGAAAPGRAGRGIFSASAALFRGILKAPLRIVSPRRTPDDTEGLEKPAAEGTVLSAAASKKTAELTPEEDLN